MDSCIPLHVLKRLKASSQELVTAGINIKLLNIPGHFGIKGNIETDKHAKETAYKIYKGYMAASINVSIKTALNLSRDIATRSCQRMWDNDLLGRYTHNLIPCVNSKVLFPSARDIGISYCRLLLHDSMSKDDSFRSGTSDSPTCECGSGKETSEHYLFDCCRYRKQREELLDQLLQLRDKNHKMLEISANLLLAPHLDNMSKCCSRIIKELFLKIHIRHQSSIINCHLPSFTMKSSTLWCFT